MCKLNHACNHQVQLQRGLLQVDSKDKIKSNVVRTPLIQVRFFRDLDDTLSAVVHIVVMGRKTPNIAKFSA